MRIRKFGEPLNENEETTDGNTTSNSDQVEKISTESLGEMKTELQTIADELKLNIDSLNKWKNSLKNFITNDTEENTPIDDIYLLLNQIIDNSEKDLVNFSDISTQIDKYKDSGSDLLI